MLDVGVKIGLSP